MFKEIEINNSTKAGELVTDKAASVNGGTTQVSFHYPTFTNLLVMRHCRMHSHRIIAVCPEQHIEQLTPQSGPNMIWMMGWLTNRSKTVTDPLGYYDTFTNALRRSIMVSS